MDENRLRIVINAPIEVVFNFTIDPRKTHLWLSSIEEEVCDVFPPKVGSIYKNRGKSDWRRYKVVELEKNKVFALKCLDEAYSVRYSYRKLGENKTELEYFEWGEISPPFLPISYLEKLKRLIEKGLV